ncbi:hypothetical protein LB504_005552 [Fusarium proliferatum]|nr:hypothetical protein LB504_005552 [Fusarium proliferatum]
MPVRSFIRKLREWQFTRNDLDLEAQTHRPSPVWAHPFKLFGYSQPKSPLLSSKIRARYAFSFGLALFFLFLWYGHAVIRREQSWLECDQQTLVV